jgi:uncharacterized membrane protein YccC
LYSLEKKQTLVEQLTSLLFFSFSDKLKFSIKVSLSMVLAYLIPLSQGWAQPQTAAITVMLIAAMGSVSESIQKGAMRVLGTMIGAIIGMTLIALFPQDRVLYLVSLSIVVTVVLYILRAYKGDPTIFMLTAITMMMVFKNGEVDDVLIYGLDRTYMTVFGIMVYTLVGVFLWPVKVQDATQQSASMLSLSQLALFRQRDAVEVERSALHATLLEKEIALTTATKDTGTIDITLSQWYSLVHHYKNINVQLTLLALHDKEAYHERIRLYIPNYDVLEREIETLFEKVENVWAKKEEIAIPQTFEVDYQAEEIKKLSHLERASLINSIQEMKRLHEELRLLAIKLNSVHSPLPTHFNTDNIPAQSRFLWGDVEHLKGALVSFIIFWVATLFWITMNPPGGFTIVALATGLSVLTTFTPIKPSMLIVVFTFSFVFATVMYIAVLPHLHYGWELGLFIFFYSFVSFHLVNPKMTIFFLLGLFTFNIMNTMYYHFGIFLLILMIFYLFLILLHIFYYVPFSTKPERLFLVNKNRFFKLAYKLLESGRKRQEGKESMALRIIAKYAELHLVSTVKSMQLWASKIDTDYFNKIEKESLVTFTKECEKFAYLVELLYHRDMEVRENTLIFTLRKNYTLPYFSKLLQAYAEGKNVQEVESFWQDEDAIVKKVEESLSESLKQTDLEQYERKEIAQMYENISLRRNVWLSLFRCQKHMKKLDFKTLEESRF